MAKKKHNAPAPAPAPETPAPAPAPTVATPPVSMTPPPAPAPALTPTPETPAPDPLDTPLVLPAALSAVLDTIPEATRKLTSQVMVPGPVLNNLRALMGAAGTTAEQVITFATMAIQVLPGFPNLDTFLVSVEQSIAAEHKANIAAAKAKRAAEEAARRAKVRADLQTAVGPMVMTLPAPLVEAINLAHKEGAYIVIHGPIDLSAPLDKQAQGSGIQVRDKLAPVARAPRAETPAGGGGGEGGGEGRTPFEYFDDTRGGVNIGGPLSKYIANNYPDSQAARILRDYEAKRAAGVNTRISAWQAYLDGRKAGDTFNLRRVEAK